MRFTRAFLFVILVVTVAVGAQSLLSDPEHVKPDHVARPVAGASAPFPLAVVGGETPQAVIAWIEGGERARWFEGVAAAEGAARVAAARATADQPVARAGARDGVGDCTGFAIPDQIIQRESGGNPYAVNPSSGAFGCAQVMPFHWAPGGACAGLDRYSIEDQRTCVDWLSQGGTRLSPWGG